MTDAQLLTAWSADADETAFRELVSRHGGFALATALRRTEGRGHLAEDATQRAFTMLARKAASLIEHPCLTAWLHRAVVLECAHLIRQESTHQRKLHHLTETMILPHADDAAPAWQAALPELDEALLRLPETDRRVLLLRFVEGHSFREIAQMIGKNEASAQKQGARALEKLSAQLRRSGHAVPVVMLSIGLASKGLLTAGELSCTVATTAMSAATHIPSTQTLLHSLRLMIYGKKLALSLAALTLLIAFTSSFAIGRNQVLLTREAMALADRNTTNQANEHSTKTIKVTAFPTVPPVRDLRLILQNITTDCRFDMLRGTFNCPIDNVGDPQCGLWLQAMAEFKADDVPEALKLLPEFRKNPKQYDVLAAIIFDEMAKTQTPQELLKMLLSETLAINGKPPLSALVFTLANWSHNDPTSAWAWRSQAVADGVYPNDPERPVHDGILTGWLGTDPAEALKTLKSLGPEMAHYGKQALADTFESEAARDQLFTTLTTVADDATAMQVARACIVSHQGSCWDWAAEKLIPWLLERKWENAKGAEVVMETMVSNSDGNSHGMELLGRAYGKTNPASEKMILELFQGFMRNPKDTKAWEDHLERCVPDPVMRQRILDSIK